ncbi:glycosyltransferase family 2 protein [Streptomyces mutabilis]|uniref:glycosyltransferase family 2 protein n=1 Tax=Streptomyces mutabilis TaxID=67332 RepID=UPI003430898C
MEHAPEPRVSVICPTYNRSRAILDTLASVTAQTVTDWEMLVVSDGSTDDTDDWVRHGARTDPRIRLLRTERHGHPSGPRNTALAEARGEFVAYLDHDDQWRADHLEVVLSLLEGGAELAATGFELRDPRGTLRAASQPYEMCWHPEFQVLGVVFEPSRVAHRRGLAERVGGWRAGAGLEDWDLWLRMTDAGARFTTVADRTTVLLDDSGTRRHRIPARHRLPLAVFDDPRAARSMLELLRSGRDAAAYRTAQLADTEEWLARLVADERFTRPLGWQGDPAAEIARARRSAPDLWPDLLVVRWGERYAVAQPLRCSTAEHAERVTSLVRRSQPRLFALLDAAAAECARTAGNLTGAGRR